MKTWRVLEPALAGTGQRLRLNPDASRHLQVLRVRPGSGIRLFDGRGLECSATVCGVDRGTVEVEVTDVRPGCPESPLAIVLEQGIGKGERMDWSIQKAVELGVSAIRPLFTERTVVRLTGPRLQRRVEHWQGVLRSACEQSGRCHLPVLQPAIALSAYWAAPGHPADALALVLDPRATLGLADLAQGRRPAAVHVLIGPEGGLSDAELAAAGEAGYRGVRLGPRVLRTETAGVVALAALQTLWGDLG